MSIEIYQKTRDYQEARWEAIRIGRLSDAAFARVMRGEVKTTAGASRLAARYEEAEAEAYQAALALAEIGIDPDALDEKDGISLGRRGGWNLYVAEVAR